MTRMEKGKKREFGIEVYMIILFEWLIMRRSRLLHPGHSYLLVLSYYVHIILR
jgi:hypothetical protein